MIGTDSTTKSEKSCIGKLFCIHEMHQPVKEPPASQASPLAFAARIGRSGCICLRVGHIHALGHGYSYNIL